MTTNWLYSFCHRALRTRFVRRFMRGLSLDDRSDLMQQLWRSANTQLGELERYQLMQMIYQGRRMDQYSLMNSSSFARSYGFFRLIETIASMPGDVVECGVGRGISFASLVYAVAFFDLEKTVYGFDSFAGFPIPDVKDLGSRIKQVDVAPAGWQDTSPNLIEAIFTRDRASDQGLLRERNVPIKLVPGFFDETLPVYLPEHIAFLHADADMYGSTIAILTHGLPRMSTGGIVIFDEYHDERWPGVKQAVDEICAEKALQVEWFPFARRYGLRL